MRASVQGAARARARAYKGCGGGVAMAIEGLLRSSIDASASGGSLLSSGAENSRRLVAAQWARELFPFDHVPARYLCVVAAGDAKADVREEGRAGLRPPGEEAFGQPAGRLAKTFGQNDAIASCQTERAETFSDAKSATRNVLPSAAAVLAYLRAQHPELGKPAALTARLPRRRSPCRRRWRSSSGASPRRPGRTRNASPRRRGTACSSSTRRESRAPGTHRRGGGGAAGARGAVPGDVRGARGRSGGRRARPALRRARRRADAPRRREAVRRARARRLRPAPARRGGASTSCWRWRARAARARRVLGRPRRRVRRRARPVRAPRRCGPAPPASSPRPARSGTRATRRSPGTIARAPARSSPSPGARTPRWRAPPRRPSGTSGSRACPPPPRARPSLRRWSPKRALRPRPRGPWTWSSSVC